MPRDKEQRTDGAVLLGGSLKDELRRHAFERCRHFFLYVFYYKALTQHLNGPSHNLGLGPADAVFVNASHQIDEGFRSDDVGYYAFDAKDPKVVDKDCTACGNMDAAHFCNLGIVGTCQVRFANVATGDKAVFCLYECLKTICGNTRLLPQRVNIGPDKRIDGFHGKLAKAILTSGKPPVSKTHLADYLKGAAAAFADYRASQLKAGNAGIVACIDCYLACYQHDGDALWQTIVGNAVSECTVPLYQLKVDDYVDRS